MSQTRNRILAIGAIAVLSLVGASAALTPAERTERFLRIHVSEKCAVYVQFKGVELRAATSVGGLNTAEPVTMLGDDGALESPDFTLPVPGDQLPDGISAVKARFGFVLLQVFGIQEKAPARVCGEIEICRPDERGAEWALVRSFEVRPSADPKYAPVIVAPVIEKRSEQRGKPHEEREKQALSIITAPSVERLGIALKLTAGGEVLSTVRRDGQGVLAAEVWVLDDFAQQATYQRGRLGDFGFRTPKTPNYSVEVEKGKYTIEARLDAGPFGVFSAEAETTVP